jgi:hypothetical protein
MTAMAATVVAVLDVDIICLFFNNNEEDYCHQHHLPSRSRF